MPHSSNTRRDHLRFRYHEAVSYLKGISLRKPEGKVRLVIFGQGRTGSTLLESLLASTGHFRPNGELLNTSRGEVRYPVHYVRGLVRRYPEENLVFHVKVYQLTEDRKHPTDPSVFLKKLSNDGWTILYLRRLNKVKHALSTILAENIGYYHKFKDKDTKTRINLDCNYFATVMEARFRFEEAERKALGKLPHLEVVYEKDLEKAEYHQPTIDGILDYLGMERKPVSTKHRKLNTQTPEELIANYDEFARLLKSRNWMNYLEHQLIR